MGIQQDRVLKVIVDREGKSDTKEIMRETGMTRSEAYGALRSLRRRAIITQSVPKVPGKRGGFLWGVATYTIRPKAWIKAKRLIEKRYGFNYESTELQNEI